MLQRSSLTAIVAGFLGNIAGVFGKYSFFFEWEMNSGIIIKFSLIALMIFFNTIQLTLFVRAMHSTESTLIAMILTFASNYIFSGLTGVLLFGETTTLIWWLGCIFVIIGLIFVIKSQNIKKLDEHEHQS